MEDFEVVKGFKSTGYLNQNVPNFPLVEITLLLFVLHYPLVEIASVRKLHNHAGL